VSTDPGIEVVKLQVGDDHPVRLAGLGAAGYRWTPLLEGDFGVADVGAGALLAGQGTGAVGASADETFTIRALRPGVARVRFAQRRPWERDDEPAANEHVVEVHIDAP
jgi:predicted secreted protein